MTSDTNPGAALHSFPTALEGGSASGLELELPVGCDCFLRTSLAPPRDTLPGLCVWCSSPGCVHTFLCELKAMFQAVISPSVLFLLLFLALGAVG